VNIFTIARHNLMQSHRSVECLLKCRHLKLSGIHVVVVYTADQKLV